MKKFKIIIFTFLFTVINLISAFSQCTLPVVTTQPVSVSGCSGSAVTLSVAATGGSSYRWYWMGNGGSNAGVVPPIYPWSGYASNTLHLDYVSGSSTGQYYVIITNACGTTTSSTVTIASLSVTVAPSNTGPACVGSSISLISGVSGTSYSWTGPNGFSSTSASPSLQNVTTAMSGVYTLTVTNSNGCTSSGTTTVTINPLPSFTVSNSGPVCVGNALQLTGPGGMTIYSWTGPNGFTSAMQSPIVSSAVTNSMTGTYMLAASLSGAGCTNTASTLATVSTAPVITSQPVSVSGCSGSAVSLSVTATEGSSYRWYWMGNGGSNAGVVPPTYPWSGYASNTLYLDYVSGSSTGQYYVVITNACGTTTSSMVTIASLSVTVAPSNTGPVCVGSSISLIPGVSGTSYSWTGPNGFSSTSASPSLQNVTTAMSGVYTLTVTNSNGCTSSGTTTVTINPLPSFTVSNNGPVCVGNALQLTGPSGMTIYSWTGPNGFTSAMQSPVVSSASTNSMTGIYMLTASLSGAGCTNTASTLATVSTAPVIISQPVNASGCSGSAVTLSVTASEGSTYRWYWMGNGGSNAGVVPPIYPWSGYASSTLHLDVVGTSTTGQYYVIITNACGTTTSSTVSMSVSGPSVTPSNTSPVCVGATARLMPGLSGGSGSISYSWTGPNGFASTAASPGLFNVTPSMAGVYTLIVTDGNGCISSGNTTVTVNSLPAFTVSTSDPVYLDSPIQLLGPAGMTGYSWTGPNSFTSAIQSPVVSSAATSSMAGTYTLTAISGVGCSMTASIIIKLPHDNSNSNYVSIITMLKDEVFSVDNIGGLPYEDYLQMTNYFDGLGRPSQVVTLQGSPLGYDLVQPTVYDPFGRENMKYLPYISQEENGDFKEDAVSQQKDFYASGTSTTAADSDPYAEITFEPSPLNRVLKQGAPGAVWQPNSDVYSMADNTVKKRYEFNLADEVLLFIYDEGTSSLSVSAESAQKYYQPNQLNANRTYDEKNNEVIEFVDKEGRVVCKKVYVTVENNIKQYAETYYIYDDLGSLIVVLPPEGVAKLKANLN